MQVVHSQRVAVGINGMLADVASLAVMLRSIGRIGERGRATIKARYYSGPEDTAISGDTLMARWMFKTEDAVVCGALCECHKQGMLKATFSANQKLSRLELLFDVMSFMQQLQRASGSGEFEVLQVVLQVAL